MIKITAQIFIYLLKERQYGERLEIKDGEAKLHTAKGEAYLESDGLEGLGWFIMSPDGFAVLYRYLRIVKG